MHHPTHVRRKKRLPEGSRTHDIASKPMRQLAYLLVDTA